MAAVRAFAGVSVEQFHAEVMSHGALPSFLCASRMSRSLNTQRITLGISSTHCTQTALRSRVQAGGGQFEIVTEHKPALEAADALLLTREAIVATGAASYHSILFHCDACTG